VIVNGPIMLHDGIMTKGFWVPEGKRISVSPACGSRSGTALPSTKATSRSADVHWSNHPHTYLQGFDYAVRTPSLTSNTKTGSKTDKNGLTPSAKITGYMVARGSD
jgi:hypothetical protein